MLPVQITSSDIPLNLALESDIRERAEKLSRFYNRISSCRVVIKVPQKHKHQGKLFNVRIDITVPGKEFAVTRKVDQDIYVAIRDAFNAIERKLEEYSQKRHGRIKAHNAVLHGHVARIIPEEGYGFIEGTDGSEYYFSMTNVTHPLSQQLAIGDAVQYFTEDSKDGQQAQHVVRERGHHLTE